MPLHSAQFLQAEEDDKLLGKKIEDVVWTLTHQTKTTRPPRWKIWESPKSEIVLYKRPKPEWLLSQFVENLPVERQPLARDPEMNARLLRRVEAELQRYADQPVVR